MPKDFSLQNLMRDLEYTVLGTEAHNFLFRIFPPVEGVLVLEPGCGSGKFGLAYALNGCEVIMLDVDPQVIEYARRLRGALNSLVGSPLATQIKKGSIHRMSFADDHFDLVFNEGVSQHWTDENRRQGSIDEMARVCKNIVVVMGNNGTNPREVEEDKTVKFGYMGMPPERKCFTPDELEMRLKKAGLRNIQVEPVTPGRLEESYLLAGWGRKGGKGG